MKLFLVFALLSSMAFASDKECENKCRSDFNECKAKVQRWVDDKYIEIEGEIYYSLNCDINERYNQVHAQKKVMKELCKSERKTCLKTCE